MDSLDRPLPAPRSCATRQASVKDVRPGSGRAAPAAARDAVNEERRGGVRRDFDPNLYTYDHAAHARNKQISEGGGTIARTKGRIVLRRYIHVYIQIINGELVIGVSCKFEALKEEER